MGELLGLPPSSHAPQDGVPQQEEEGDDDAAREAAFERAFQAIDARDDDAWVSRDEVCARSRGAARGLSLSVCVRAGVRAGVRSCVRVYGCVVVRVG